LILLGLLAGFVIGLVLAAPIGPLGALAAYQAADNRLRAAWMLAVGACVADSVLALLATWSIGLPVTAHYLDGVLSLILFGLAIHLAMTAKSSTLHIRSSAGLGVGFGATLLHPINLVTFAVAFSWLHGHGLVIEGWEERLGLVGGIFAGALAVWGVVIMAAMRLGKHAAMERFQVRFKYVLAGLCGATALGALANFLRVF